MEGGGELERGRRTEWKEPGKGRSDFLCPDIFKSFLK